MSTCTTQQLPDFGFCFFSELDTDSGKTERQLTHTNNLSATQTRQPTRDNQEPITTAYSDYQTILKSSAITRQPTRDNQQTTNGRCTKDNQKTTPDNRHSTTNKKKLPLADVQTTIKNQRLTTDTRQPTRNNYHRHMYKGQSKTNTLQLTANSPQVIKT